MPPLPVVSNTSPIINLAGVDLLHVLHDLYGKIWIPEAVFIEFRHKAYPNGYRVSVYVWGSYGAAPTRYGIPPPRLCRYVLVAAGGVGGVECSRARRSAHFLDLLPQLPSVNIHP
jgi:hypothetical protein